MDGYAEFCQALPLSDRALRDRLRLARRFLEAHPDLTAWMARPLDARLADLVRIRAWPLVTYAILTRRLPVDLELLVAKDLGGFGRAAERQWPDDFTAARVAAARLGWASNWTDAVLRECLALESRTGIGVQAACLAGEGWRAMTCRLCTTATRRRSNRFLRRPR